MIQVLLASKVFKDDIYCHIVSGLGAGFFAVTIGSPVDVVKSRMMGDSQVFSYLLFRDKIQRCQVIHYTRSFVNVLFEY